MKDGKALASAFATGLLVLPAVLPAAAQADAASQHDGDSGRASARDDRIATVSGPATEPVDVYGPAEPVNGPASQPEAEQGDDHPGDGKEAAPKALSGQDQVLIAIGGVAVLAAVGGGAAVAMSRGRGKDEQGDAPADDGKWSSGEQAPESRE